MNRKQAKGWAGLILLGLLTSTPAGAETLQQAWDIALKVDRSLKAARENSAAAAYQLEAAKAVRLPGVSLEAGYRTLNNIPESKADFGQFPTGEKSSLSYTATASLPLYTSGRISSGINAADATLRASRTQESGKALDLKLKVVETFVAVLRAAQGVAVANSHVASLKSHTRDVENRHKQGMASRNDLLAAQVALADAEQEAIKAENTLDLAKSTYNRLLGRPLNRAVTLDNLQPELLDDSLKALTERSLRQRHELMVLQDRIRALHHQAAGIRAETAPQVTLSGGYGFQENQYQVHEGQWSVNLGMQWNLFDGGITRHKISATNRQAAALQEQYDDLVSNIALQVRQYWLSVQETHKRIRVTEKAIIQADENIRVNRNRYENGLSTNTEVLDAETLRTRSHNNHANAVYDAVLATLRLKRAVGEL